MSITLEPMPAQSWSRLVSAAVGALGLSCIMSQLALTRELMGAFGGNEMVLGVALGLWLLLMGIGTRLGCNAQKLRQPVRVLAAAQVMVALLPLAQVFLLRALRNVVFVRGAEVGVEETVGAALVLLLPYCLLAGYALTLASSLLTHHLGSVGIGRIYVADSLGSIVGGFLFSFVLIPFLDHLTLLLLPALLNLVAAAALALTLGSSSVSRETDSTRAPRSPGLRRALGAIAVTLASGLVLAVTWGDLDHLATQLQYPSQHLVAHANSPYGRLIVTQSDGQYDMIANGVPLISTRDDQHVEETVHYAMAQRPDAQHVLLISGGVSGTAREILKYGPRQVDYVELDPLILKLARQFLPQILADSRIHTISTDGRLFVKQAMGQYEIAILDLPAPSTAQINRFYTVEFLRQLKRALAKDGVMSFGLGQYENYLSPELARILAIAKTSLNQAFRNVLLVPGSRVFFLASDGPLLTNVAAVIEQRKIHTRLLNQHYLDAMLTADRVANVAAASSLPAPVNHDFSPTLYYYYLRHWMSQFHHRFGLLPAALLALLAFYMLRLRGGALVLFASGFAASALELVLLLTFQVLCGSVYHQVGIIVTVFMLGLSCGASMSNRLFVQMAPNRSQPSNQASLAYLAWGIAGYAALLPFCLSLLSRMNDLAPFWSATKAVIALLTLGLAWFVGMQFPLANQLAFSGDAQAAAHLYTADFVGASLGALLTCTLLIPTIGLTGVCLLTAALNSVSGGLLKLRGAAI